MPRKPTLSMELLETFVLLLDNSGDAGETARQLDLNQPSMSKRMAMLQRGRVKRPWLRREGKTWYATEEGERVLPAVQEVVRRYRKLVQYVKTNEPELADVTFACGQRVATGFVLEAVAAFRERHPRIRLRLSTLRARHRIEGVASGRFDLAAVTEDEDTIRQVALRPVHIESLHEDRLALVCSQNSSWQEQITPMSDGKVRLRDLVGLPLIVPEHGSQIRKQLELEARQKLQKPLDVTLELGGWHSMLTYVRNGLGVGVVVESACNGEKDLLVRTFDRKEFPPRQLRLISCQKDDAREPDLSPDAELFRQELLRAAWDTDAVRPPR